MTDTKRNPRTNPVPNDQFQDPETNNIFRVTSTSMIGDQFSFVALRDESLNEKIPGKFHSLVEFQNIVKEFNVIEPLRGLWSEDVETFGYDRCHCQECK